MKAVYLVFALITMLFIGLYSLTGADGLTTYADSDGLILSIHQQGLAHPPGYPWLPLAFHWLMNLAPDGNTAIILAHRIGGLAQALAIGLLGITGYLSLRLVGTSKKLGLAGSVLGSILWGLSLQTWYHGTHLEIFPFAQVVAILFVLVTLKLWGRFKKKRSLDSRLLASLVLLSGIALHIHQLTVLIIAPGWIALFLALPEPKIRRELALSVVKSLVIFVGLFGLYLPFTQDQPLYGWGFIYSISGIAQFFLRLVYDPGGSAIETYAMTVDLAHSFSSLGFWFRYWIQEAHLLLVALSVFGIYWLMKKSRSLGRLLLVTILLSGPVVVAYIKLPDPKVVYDLEYFWGTALRLRMFYIFSLVAGLASMFGIVALLERLPSRLHRWVVSMLVILIILVGDSHYSQIRQIHSWDVDNYTEQVLIDLPNESVLIVDSDLSFSFLSAQIIRDVRPDIFIVPSAMVMRSSWWSDMRGELYLFDYQDLTEQLAHIVAFNLARERQVFVYAANPELLSYLDLNMGLFYAIPYGYTLKIDSEPQLIPSLNYAASLNKIYLPQSSWWSRGLRAHLAQHHTMMAYYAKLLGEHHTAEGHRRLALGLSVLPQTKQVVRSIIPEAELILEELIDLDTDKFKDPVYWMEISRDVQQSNEKYYALSRAWLLDPLNPEVYLAFSSYFRQAGDIDRAEIEMRRAETIKSFIDD